MPAIVPSQPIEEPWVFHIQAGLDGAPCSVELLHGPDSATGGRIAASIRRWRFSPLLRGRLARCIDTKVYVYVRMYHGRSVFVVPGLRELGH
jgi:hypothetical protein